MNSSTTLLGLGLKSIVKMTPAEFAKGHDTVTMVFTRDVLFTPYHGARVQYTQGVHEVPRKYSGHWYLRANGAEIRAAMTTA